MDIFAHILWANAGAKGANKVLDKKDTGEKKKKLSPAWAGFWGVFPDLFAFGIPSALVIISILSGDLSFSDFSHHGRPSQFDISAYLYQYSHSLVIFAMVFLLVWLFYRRPRFELLGWLLHILIDIPTHKIEFFPTPFLWPISEYRFPYGISWAEPWFMAVNYTALFIVFLYFNMKKKKKD